MAKMSGQKRAGQIELHMMEITHQEARAHWGIPKVAKVWEVPIEK
jgi:hypothetical protein